MGRLRVVTGGDGVFCAGNRAHACGQGIAARCAVVVVIAATGAAVIDAVVVVLRFFGHRIKLAAVDGVGAGSADFAGSDVLDLPFGTCFANRDLVACRNVCAACKTAVGDAAHRGLGYAGGGGIGVAVCAKGNSVGFV